jgi:hypothetical protein
MTQTAVEWLFTLMVDPNYPIGEQKKWLEQALQMEKEQMIEFAWQYSVDEITKEGLILEFNEKYGGKP